MHCTLDHFIDGAWREAGTVEALGDPAAGHRGRTRFAYAIDYALAYLEQPPAAVACGYPVTLESHVAEGWPPFLLDLLPQGAGRLRALDELGLAAGGDGPGNDWRVLLHAAGNPPGALRIREAVPASWPAVHPGFARDDVIERGADFIEYARSHGAPVAGSTGAQGDAPKFLLSVDAAGYWHADGALADGHAAAHYLVKFPRGKAPSDRQVLRNEAPYYEVARRFGLRVGTPLEFTHDTLFVRRFDREVRDGRVLRHGLESLYSLAGVAAFGQTVPHERLVAALVRHVAPGDRHEEVTEYLLRDVLNVALHNTDNHGRNSAVLKVGGRVRLSPLYDFAPMFLDDAGIARVVRWSGALEELGMPRWAEVADALAVFGVDVPQLRARLAACAATVHALPEVMAEAGVETEIIERLRRRIALVADGLRRCG